ncbi:hypothetical protein [Paraburkholderia dokdonensis]|uniref:hypothetical protein n=1 Tax=Paraburkholderia dokdonensis TaxID=2211211 RepID=UPI00135CE322|nr:hypothetical protein [Paraburkholderia dokdonensis]
MTAHKRQTGKFYNRGDGAGTPPDIDPKRGGTPAAGSAAGVKHEAVEIRPDKKLREKT